ncbi:MAG: sarcosine oxidase subunit delta, partial [Arcicella sp.]|nr:sarcosine oxidase subunit delta [Arcicella sp.]
YFVLIYVLLFFRDNPRGIHHELWVHAASYRLYFNATRHTVTYEILETYKIGEKPRFTAAGGAEPQAIDQGVTA